MCAAARAAASVRLLSATDEPHRGTEPSQLERGRPADARRGARHDDDTPGEVGRRAPVLKTGAHDGAGPAEAADDARLECGVDHAGEARRCHAKARRKPAAARSAMRANARAMRGAARRRLPARRALPHTEPATQDRPTPP